MIQIAALAGMGLWVGSLLTWASHALGHGRLRRFELLAAAVPLAGAAALRDRKPSLARRLFGLQIAAALTGAWAGSLGPDPMLAMLSAVLGWQLLLIAAVDAEHLWLPDVLTFPLAASGLAAAALLDRHGVMDAAIGTAAGWLGLWLIGQAYFRFRRTRGLGGGDPYLLAAIGAWVGWIGLPSVLIWASVSGLSLVVVATAMGRRVAMSDRLPFGVFLAIGGWMTWVFGPLGQ